MKLANTTTKNKQKQLINTHYWSIVHICAIVDINMLPWNIKALLSLHWCKQHDNRIHALRYRLDANTIVVLDKELKNNSSLVKCRDSRAPFSADTQHIDAREATAGNMSQPSAVSNSVEVKYVMYTIIDIVIMDYIDSYIIYDLRNFAVKWLHVYV